jgi:glycerophosphoryl diester phosphodiesterase
MASIASRSPAWTATSELKPLHPVLHGGPLLIAHRGGAGLAPENTLLAFQRAADWWHADMIELDVHASADGLCMVIHDATVERTTNGTGRVDSLTSAQLRSLDAGFRFTLDDGRSFPFRDRGLRIPTIDEVLAALPNMRFTVELKTAAAQRPLFAAIERAGANDRIVAAGEWRLFRTQFDAFRGCVSAAHEDVQRFYVLHRLHLATLAPRPADVVQTCEFSGRRRVLTQRLIADLRRKGVPTHVWTINETTDMHRLLDWGADGIITDRPDRLARVLHERLGRGLPPGEAGPGQQPVQS